MQLYLPRHIVEKSWAKKLDRPVSAWTATRPPVARNRTKFGVSVKRRLVDWLERQSVVLSSRGRLGIAGLDSAKAYVKERARRLHRRVTSLASKVAAKTTATTSR